MFLPRSSLPVCTTAGSTTQPMNPGIFSKQETSPKRWPEQRPQQRLSKCRGLWQPQSWCYGHVTSTSCPLESWIDQELGRRYSERHAVNDQRSPKWPSLWSTPMLKGKVAEIQLVTLLKLHIDPLPKAPCGNMFQCKPWKALWQFRLAAGHRIFWIFKHVFFALVRTSEIQIEILRYWFYHQLRFQSFRGCMVGSLPMTLNRGRKLVTVTLVFKSQVSQPNRSSSQLHEHCRRHVHPPPNTRGVSAETTIFSAGVLALALAESKKLVWLRNWVRTSLGTVNAVSKWSHKQLAEMICC